MNLPQVRIPTGHYCRSCYPNFPLANGALTLFLRELSCFLIRKYPQEIDKTSLTILENALDRLKIPPPQAPTRNDGLPVPHPEPAAVAYEAPSSSCHRPSAPLRKRTEKCTNTDLKGSRRPRKRARKLASNDIADSDMQFVVAGPTVSRTVWDVDCQKRLGSTRSVSMRKPVQSIADTFPVD